MDWLLPLFARAVLVFAVFVLAVRGAARLRSSRAPRWLEAFLAAQALLIVVVLCVPFGFDHPSALGLDFGHLLLVAALYALLLIAGLAAAIQRREWRLLWTQVLAPCVVLGLGAAGLLGG
jgi:hypothetical protein